MEEYNCIDSFWVSLYTIERTLPSKAFVKFITQSYNAVSGEKATKLKEVKLSKLKDFTFDILFAENLIIRSKDNCNPIIFDIKN
jgi:hypothetical protein